MSYSTKSLAKVLPVTLPRFCQVFTKSFLGQSTSRVLLCEEAWWSSRRWPHGAFNWLVSLWCRSQAVCRCVRRDSTDMQKVGKKGLHWLRIEFKFLLNLCEHRRTLWNSSDPSYKNRNKRREYASVNHQSIYLFGIARWTHFIYIKNWSDQRQLCDLGFLQVSKTTLRVAFIAAHNDNASTDNIKIAGIRTELFHIWSRYIYICLMFHCEKSTT